jgi:two-component system LytT family response regulator
LEVTLVLKVLVVDDDAGMRLFIQKILEKTPGFELVGEAGDGETALRLFETLQPQVIFMDIEMPGLNGVECAKRIGDLAPLTFFIFATAHEEYMPEAFEVYAADYLVKPFNPERIKQTLERIKKLRLGETEKEPSFTPAPRHDKGTHGGALEKLIIKNKEGISLIDLRDIILIQKEERNTVIYTVDNRYPTSESLNELMERLEPALFFRSHKSYIINLAMIQKIYPYGRWTYLVKLKHTTQDALLTSDHYEELEKIFATSMKSSEF